MRNKNQLARIKVIHRALSRRACQTKELQARLSEYDLVACYRTIQKDIQNMQEDAPHGIGAPIEYDKKTKKYFYTHKFTYESFGLQDEEINALLFYSQIIHQYQDYEIFDKIASAVEKIVKSRVPPNAHEFFKSKIIIETEKALPIRGHHYIKLLTEALGDNLKVRFRYSKFGETETTRVISPCLLKEDKHIWYILGVPEGRKKAQTFALDRILSLELLDERTDKVEFNADEHFKYSLGITVTDETPKNIILSFTPAQGNYIKALPIHFTQEILKDDNKEFRISIRVLPTYELYSKILSFGNDVKVISPFAIAEEVSKKLKKAFKQYS